MIELNCPTCSKQYHLPDETAGQKTKCRECGESLVVPSPRDEDLRWWKPGEEPKPPEKSPPPVPAPSPPENSAPASAPVDDQKADPFFDPLHEIVKGEPPYFERARKAADVLQYIALFTGCIAGCVSFVAAFPAFQSKDASLGWFLLAGAVVSFVGIAMTVLVTNLAMVLIDMGRSLRVLRPEASSPKPAVKP
jgi:hypothetical protein